MNLRLVAAIFVLAATPAFAQAQVTLADVKKFIQDVAGDKAKIKSYCDLGEIEKQMGEAEERKDNKRMEELAKQMEAVAQPLGPDYVRIMKGIEQIDVESKEGKDLTAAFETLEKLCPQ